MPTLSKRALALLREIVLCNKIPDVVQENSSQIQLHFDRLCDITINVATSYDAKPVEIEQAENHCPPSTPILDILQEPQFDIPMFSEIIPTAVPATRAMAISDSNRPSPPPKIFGKAQAPACRTYSSEKTKIGTEPARTKYGAAK